MSAVRRAADEATVLRLETATYTVPTDAPEADGTLAWDSTTLVVVHAFAADGTTGLGWTYAGRACQTLIDDQLTGSVLGRSALDVPGCLEAMVRACLGRPGVVSCAIAAVELAMWDLKARPLGLPLGLPLCRLLGQGHCCIEPSGEAGTTDLPVGSWRHVQTAPSGPPKSSQRRRPAEVERRRTARFTARPSRDRSMQQTSQDFRCQAAALLRCAQAAVSS